ncbi:hypothetical protein FNV43_RR24813 [Rhamnella rubrinervis]|uniref:Glycosyltransferase n=1 Tax=Rhamnella rubrinervis TaxID=2594499 RepID=A0A8K0DTU0_9ROSA|nr:hypothetical protein FNV43_RR24813 [Rhamnella rubrinervis]
MATNHHHRHNHQNHGQEEEEEEASVIVLMVPFPIHSHSNQLLLLSSLISSYNILVHFAGCASQNSQVRSRAHSSINPNQFSKVQFHDFTIPPFVPDPNSDSSEFLLPHYHVVKHLRQPVSALLHNLSKKTKRIVVIHDVLTSSAVQDVPSIPNAESYIFQAVTAFTVLGFVCNSSSQRFIPTPKELAHEIHNPIQIPSLEGLFSSETSNFFAMQTSFMRFASGHIYNSCRLIDGAFLDLLMKIHNDYKDKKFWAVGPLHQLITSKNIEFSDGKNDKCLGWLDKQEPNSVLYVSFGTTISMADHDQQLKELALGLELSGAKFIWVCRDADHDKRDGVEGGNKRPQLLDRLADRVKGVGLVVRDWAPQTEILQHPSTGGFLSHCGWNSCLESISNGVPIATWPMHSDQPLNAVLVTEALRIGLNVKDWARRDEVVSSSEISKAVRRLMASDEGDEMRKRAKELGKAVRSATNDGGVSCVECDSFIDYITRS